MIATRDQVCLVELSQRIAQLPRFRVARLPTPLDEAPRLSQVLGGVNVFIKREDMTGLAFGGNKTRELDFFVGDARNANADVFIAGGGVTQSNHAVQCAAAARRAGMLPVAVLHGSHSDEPQGNLLLSRLLDVDVRLVDTSTIDSIIYRRDALHWLMQDIASEFRARGHRPYVLRSSFHPLGVVGYVSAFIELAEQISDRNIELDHLYLASVGATHVGLALGAKHLGYPCKVTGINYALEAIGLRDRMKTLAEEAAKMLGITTRLDDDDLAIANFAGPGYGLTTPESIEAIKLLAKTEGVFLDPVYTGKGMAGLLAHVHDGRVRPGETVVFVHTGGTPALFAYNSELLKADRRREGI